MAGPTTPEHIQPLFSGGPGISPQVPGTGVYAQVPVGRQIQPYQIILPPGGGVAQTSPGSGKYIAPTHGAFSTGAGMPECWICPPYGSGERPTQAALSVCALAQRDPSQFSHGYTPQLVPAGQSPSCAGPQPPSPPVQIPTTAGGGAAISTRGYSQLPPAVSSPLPNVSINGQPMVCCPCTT